MESIGIGHKIVFLVHTFSSWKWISGTNCRSTYRNIISVCFEHASNFSENFTCMKSEILVKHDFVGPLLKLTWFLLHVAWLLVFGSAKLAQMKNAVDWILMTPWKTSLMTQNVYNQMPVSSQCYTGHSTTKQSMLFGIMSKNKQANIAKT